MRKRSRFMAHSAIIAAIYTVLCYLQNFILPGSASWAIQMRAAEALSILAFFTPAAIPGLTLGCLISNIVTGCALPDVIFGTLATFLGAVGSYALRKNRFMVSIPPIVSNMIIIPFVLSYAYHIPGGIPYFMLTVGAGEVISCLIFGQILISALNPFRNTIFGGE